MEMRLIILYLLKDFTFSLSEKQQLADTKEYQGINRATLGPRNVMDPRPLANKLLLDTPSTGLWVDISLDQTIDLDKTLVSKMIKQRIKKIFDSKNYMLSKL